MTIKKFLLGAAAVLLFGLVTVLAIDLRYGAHAYNTLANTNGFRINDALSFASGIVIGMISMGGRHRKADS